MTKLLDTCPKVWQGEQGDFFGKFSLVNAGAHALIGFVMLKAGIVGLPNVGKSTLFNAVTRTHKAVAENYPFCTIEPNLGVVTVPDPRLEPLGRVAKVTRLIPATIEFVDIAGLVKGASRGEGLGNRFLSHIREVDAILQVVRCFEDPDIHHVTGSIDPVRDIEIVNTELILADLETVRKRREKLVKEVKHGDKAAVIENQLLDKIEPHLDAGNPAGTLQLAREEREVSKLLFLLTDKPTVFAANIAETDLAGAEENPHIAKVREYAAAHHACETVVVCAQLESDLADLSPEEAKEYLRELSVSETGSAAIIRKTCQLLNLRTFFTFNEKEVRAWTIHAGDTAPKAAGAVHSDFERGFIKAEAVKWDHLVECGSMAAARDKGHHRLEGKEYVVEDGDVLLFRFQV
jgi:ribosome-binding ATPase